MARFQEKIVETEYLVKGVEEVLDSFDEFEHDNELEPIIVKAVSVSDAVSKGTEALQERVDKYRREGGFISSGSFTAYATEVRDSRGTLLRKINRPERIY
jgi:hypothetical protein